jgi:hypothetical protein
VLNFKISRDETLDNKPIIFVRKRVKTHPWQRRITKFFGGRPPDPPTPRGGKGREGGVEERLRMGRGREGRGSRKGRGGTEGLNEREGEERGEKDEGNV